MSTGQPPVTDGVDLASIGRRFGALMVDWLLCLLVAGLFHRPLATNPWPPLVLVIEYAIFIGLFTTTPGMRLTGIACISTRTGGAVGIPRAALRGLLLALAIPALIMDGYGRGLHDKAAGTVMVRARRPKRTDRA